MMTGPIQDEPQALRGVALVVRERKVTLRIGHEQGRPDRDPPEGLFPDRAFDDGVGARVRRELEDQRAAGRQRTDRRLEIGGRAGEGHVAVDEHVDDRRAQGPVLDDRGDDGQSDEPLDRDRRSDILVRHAGREVRGHRGEDVAPVEARRDHRQHEVAVLEGARLGDAAQRLGAGDEQAVVGADEDVTPGDLEGHREAFRPDPRVDHGDVGADRHVRQGEHQRAGTVADRVARHLMVDVDHVRIRADAEHDAPADGRRGRPEIGQERDDGSHAEGWYRTRTCVEAAPGGGFGAASTWVSTGRAGRRDPPSRSGMCWSVRAGRTPVAGTEPARPGQLAQEEQLIDLAQRPADLVDRDATHEGGQIGRFLRAESLHQQMSIGRPR